MTYFENKKVDWADEMNGLSLNEAKSYLDRLIKHLGENAKLKLEYEWESIDFFIEVERTPTEAELNAERLKKEKKEKADRAKFEKLKSEYGW